MSLLASDVKLPQDLSSIFSGIGTNAYNTIGSNYGAARGRAASDATARGFSGPGGYSTERLGAQQGLDVGNLESGVGGELGNAGYKNTLSQRDYQQQGQLANAYASAMRPDLLQQIFAGIGSGASAAGNAAGLYSLTRGMGGGGGPEMTGGPLSLYGGGGDSLPMNPDEEYNYYMGGGY